MRTTINHGTVSFTVHSGDYEFTGITGMRPDTDYLVEDGENTVTITNEKLHSLENGLHNIAFVFTGGKDALFLEIQTVCLSLPACL